LCPRRGLTVSGTQRQLPGGIWWPADARTHPENGQIIPNTAKNGTPWAAAA
jgi:hypothetical protein